MYSDDRCEVEIENSVDLDPLKADPGINKRRSAGHLTPEILCKEIVLILIQLIKLNLQPILHLIGIDHILETLKTQPIPFLLHPRHIGLFQRFQPLKRTSEKINRAQASLIINQLIIKPQRIQLPSKITVNALLDYVFGLKDEFALGHVIGLNLIQEFNEVFHDVLDRCEVALDVDAEELQGFADVFQDLEGVLALPFHERPEEQVLQFQLLLLGRGDLVTQEDR